MNLYLLREIQENKPLIQDELPLESAGGTETILLVEDDRTVRESTRSRLLDLGCRVLEAANGKDALQIIGERREIDLLFIDVVMPGGLNGRDLALEACSLNPRLRVLYCPGYSESAVFHHQPTDVQ